MQPPQEDIKRSIDAIEQTIALLMVANFAGADSAKVIGSINWLNSMRDTAQKFLDGKLEVKAQ